MYYAVSASAAVIIAAMLALNGELTAVYGQYPATLIIHIAGLAAVSAAALIKRENPFKAAKGLPPALFTGGVINYFNTFFNTIALGRISVTAILALSLLGQAAASLAVDRFGLLGMPKRRLGAPEFAGLAVTALGIAALLRGEASAPIVPVAVSLLSGAACVGTRQVTAQLSERTSLLTGAWYSYFTGTLCAVIGAAAAAAFGQAGGFAAGVSPRAWIYLGGALGAAAVYLQNIAVRHMSSFAMTLILFAGQVLGGVVIDAAFYGSFSAQKLAGGALAFAGLALNALASRRPAKAG